MAEVTLSRAEAADGLPLVCMQCGGPATTEVSRTFNDAPTTPPVIPEDPVGCIVAPIQLVLALFVRRMRNEATVRMPLCANHARGWFNGSAPQASAISDEAVTMTGVSEAFVRALEERRASRPPEATGTDGTTPLVKVRCGSCRALNEESARYCNQCGSEL